jgi:microcystin-dependent protein
LDAVGGEATTDTPFATAMLAVGAKNVYVENKQYPVVPATDPPTTKGPTLAAMSSLSVGTFTGGSKPVSIMQPFLAVNFIIALDGIFPPRS